MNLNKRLQDNTVEIDYGFAPARYLTVFFISLGVSVLLSATYFTLMSYSLWFILITWIVGADLIIVGVIWHIMMGFAGSKKLSRKLNKQFIDFLRKIWDGKGKVLDIGTGAGRAAVESARAFPETEVTGIDIWTNAWVRFGLSKERAQRNAQLAGVNDRCVFKKGSALEIPFEDNSFQLVVSSFVFHEIRIPDRIELFREAIRVLEKNGTFVICDAYRYIKGYNVDDIMELVNKIQQLGAANVGYISIQDAGTDIVFAGRFWKIGFIYGKKI
ncbi:methyltransferase domain-containing protein [Candidatus Poribacteria bacterium]|nr:methyltransferase domain-containing protein [Candidatus Poribacteria bacterium]